MISDDLAFVAHQGHRRIVHGILSECLGDQECVGVLIEGSVARGDATPGSDVDLRILLTDGADRPFHTDTREGIRLEIHYNDFERARAELRQNPMQVYSYLDGRILLDPKGRFAALTHLAQDIFDSYQVPPRDRQRLAYWLITAREKIDAAVKSGDPLKAALIAKTTSWQILEGLWAANSKPMPPAGAILAHLRDLTTTPEDLKGLIHELLLGNFVERINAATTLMAWAGHRLEV